MIPALLLATLLHICLAHQHRAPAISRGHEAMNKQSLTLRVPSRLIASDGHLVIDAVTLEVNGRGDLVV